MNNPPVAYSTPHPAVLIHLLESRYGLNIRELVFLKRGFNDTYRIDTVQGPLILRLFRAGRRTEAEIRTELEWLCLLSREGVPVSVPLRDKEEQVLQTLEMPEGPRHAALFSFASGRIIRKPDVNQCLAAGEALGRMHQLGAGTDPGPLHWNYHPQQIFSFVRQSLGTCLNPFPD
ncbi:MAG TPA: phosphotransferase, partial [Bacteroidia bacterium]|nr:phosphotransferase [Bacteroidia bacterium]